MYVCISLCTLLYTTKHTTVLIIFNLDLQTNITALICRLLEEQSIHKGALTYMQTKQEKSKQTIMQLTLC